MPRIESLTRQPDLRAPGPIARRTIARIGVGIGLTAGAAGGMWVTSKSICENRIYSFQNISRTYASGTMENGLKEQYFRCQLNIPNYFANPSKAKTPEYLFNLGLLAILTLGGGFVGYGAAVGLEAFTKVRFNGPLS